jgi:hypothetical protein
LLVAAQGRWHVELLARCVREGRDLDKGSVAQESLDLAETVLAVSRQTASNNLRSSVA